MSNIPYAEEKWPTYENFIAGCPACGFENVFNRASDLNTFEPIGHKQVYCLNSDCAQPFIISGDSVNAAYEMFIHDCHELRRSKHYAYCILNLAQAFELFFSQYLRVELLYKPFATDSKYDIEDVECLNNLSTLLYDKVKPFSFAALRSLFFYQILQPNQPSSLQEAEVSIKALPAKPSVPSNKDIQSIADKRLSPLLLRLKSCQIGEVRNKVVHKHAYRPTLVDVNTALQEAREILFPLADNLNVKCDDVNWYIGSTTRI